VGLIENAAICQFFDQKKGFQASLFKGNYQKNVGFQAGSFQGGANPKSFD
jgi:hypothetical protein